MRKATAGDRGGVPSARVQKTQVPRFHLPCQKCRALPPALRLQPGASCQPRTV